MDVLNLMGGSEKLFLMEGLDEPATDTGAGTVAEAEVSISVSSSDEQIEDLSSDQAADDVVEVTQNTAEMFYALSNMHNLTKLLSSGELSASLYAMLNKNGSLDALTGTKLASCESLDPTGNATVATSIKASLESRLAAIDAKGNSKKGFQLIEQSLAKFKASFEPVMETRFKNIAALVAKLESEQVSAEVSVSVTEPTEEAPATTVTEIPEVPADAPEDTVPTPEVETSADVATPEEVEEAIEALKLASLSVTPIMTHLGKMAEGDTNAIAEVKAFVNTIHTANKTFRRTMSGTRKFVVSKQSLLNACNSYMKNVQEMNSVGAIFHGATVLAKSGQTATIGTAESFDSAKNLLLSIGEANRYLTLTKKVMDSSYYNLKFLATKFFIKK